MPGILDEPSTLVLISRRVGRVVVRDHLVGRRSSIHVDVLQLVGIGCDVGLLGGCSLPQVVKSGLDLMCAQESAGREVRHGSRRTNATARPQRMSQARSQIESGGDVQNGRTGGHARFWRVEGKISLTADQDIENQPRSGGALQFELHLMRVPVELRIVFPGRQSARAGRVWVEELRMVRVQSYQLVLGGQLVGGFAGLILKARGEVGGRALLRCDIVNRGSNGILYEVERGSIAVLKGISSVEPKLVALDGTAQIRVDGFVRVNALAD